MAKFPKSSQYNFAKTLVKRHKLVDYLEKYLTKEVTGLEFSLDPKEKDDAWHPSGHCTPSVTDLYAVATGRAVEKDWGSLYKTFAVGHFWHQLLQKAVLDLELAAPEAIERRGFNCWGPDFSQVVYGGDAKPSGLKNYRPYNWATGAGDVAPCEIPVHGDYIVDFKTMSGQQFRQADIPAWAADKYEAQINIYMDFFDIEQGLIVGICKDSPHDMKEYEFRRNQDLIDAIYAKWQFVSGCIDDDYEPTTFDNDEFSLEGLFKGPVAQ